ncbi:nitrogen regulatory protein NtrP [Gemmatimonadetes bacterium T265]|nr:nitrogen regulatory protein NtrP [Gemmatimonadetes bacterium T265]
MGETGIAKLFQHGRSQAVRLPKAFRMPGDRVRVRRVEGGRVLLEPIYATTEEWFAAMDAVATDPSFMADGRQQPPMPPPKDLFD